MKNNFNDRKFQRFLSSALLVALVFFLTANSATPSSAASLQVSGSVLAKNIGSQHGDFFSQDKLPASSKNSDSSSLGTDEVPSPLINDAFSLPDYIQAEKMASNSLDVAGSNSTAPGRYDTSVYMTNTVAVGIVLPESTGSGENWTDPQKTTVVQEIQAGMNWWKAHASPAANLNFVYDLQLGIPTTSEPITMYSYQEGTWIGNVMGNMGYTDSSYFERVYSYNNHLRSQYSANWALTIFVVNSYNDSDGMFRDGYFGYAYLGGPFIVMTYDNDGWGIANMNWVTSHETGHIFLAGDQYYQAGYGGCTSTTEKYGYLGVTNSNCEYNNPNSIPSIMRSNEDALEATASGQIGWKDSNSNGVPDTIDTNPVISIAAYSPDPTTQTQLTYTGKVFDNPWPHAVCGAGDVCYDVDIDVNTITSVQYRVDSGAWLDVTANDGSINSDYEGVSFTTNSLTPGQHTIEVKAINSLDRSITWSDTVTITSSYSITVSKTGTGSGTVTSSPVGINCGSTCYAPFDNGSLVTLSAAASTGSTFTGWSGSGCSGTGTCEVTVNGAKTVSAAFTLNTYLLDVSKTGTGSGTVTSSPAGINCGATCAYAFNYNTSVTLTASANAGSLFSGWSGAGCSGTGTCIVSMTAVKSVSAGFELVPGAFNKSLPANGATGSSTNPILSWETSNGATSYSYCYDKTDDNACTNWINNGTSTSVTLSNLSANTKYYWHVRAANAAGLTYSNASSTAFWNFKTGVLPGAFLKSSPTSGSTNKPLSLTLKWLASSGATSYWVCYDATNDNACSNWVNNGTALSRVISGLSASTTYYWHVRADNAVGSTYSNSSSTAFWKFTTTSGGGSLPGAFNKTSPAKWATGVSTSPTLSWGASSGATSYAYCIDSSNDNACTSWISNGTATSVPLSGLSPSTVYYWHVKAMNATGTTYANGTSTSFWSFTTGAGGGTLPGAFNKISPAKWSTGVPRTVTFSWGASSGASSYQYCYDTSNDNLCSNWVDNGTNTSVLVSGLSPLTDYYWHVRAINASGTTYANASLNFWKFTTAQ